MSDKLEIRWFTEYVKVGADGCNCSLCGNKIQKFMVSVHDEENKRYARFHEGKCWSQVYNKKMK